MGRDGGLGKDAAPTRGTDSSSLRSGVSFVTSVATVEGQL